jgi:phage shock protein A
MDPQAEKLAEIAERIERDLKRINDASAISAQRSATGSHGAAPGPLARVLARFRRGSKTQPIQGGEDPRFSEVQRRLESLEKHRVALTREATQQRTNADKWERNAKLAVRAGDDDLAREALSRKREALDTAAALEREAETISAAVAEYTSALAIIKASSQ